MQGLTWCCSQSPWCSVLVCRLQAAPAALATNSCLAARDGSAPTKQLPDQLWLQTLLLEIAFSASTVCTCLICPESITAICLVQADRVPAPLRDEFIVKRVLGVPEEIRRLHLAGVVAVKNRNTLDQPRQTLEQAQASEATFFREQVIANLVPERQAMQQLIESNITVPELIRSAAAGTSTSA